MHLPYIIFYDIGVLDKKIFLRKNSMQKKKKQNKKPNKKTELSFPNDYSLYIPMDLYNFDTPNPWLPNPYSGEHDLKKKYWIYPTWGFFHAQIPYCWARKICIHSELSPLERKCVPSFWHTGFFFHQTMFCAKFDWN